MVYRSSNFPKIFGILLVLACIGFLWETFVFFMLPSTVADIAIPGYALEIIGEFGFCGYLLIKGARTKITTSKED
jgi:hypothetical protein